MSHASSASLTAMNMRRRFGKWLGITAVFAFIPVLFDAIVLTSRNQDITAIALFSGASTYLIGFGICAASFGDALFDRRYSGYMDGWTLAAILSSVIALAAGAALYAVSKSAGQSGWGLPVFYIGCSSALSLYTVWTTGK